MDENHAAVLELRPEAVAGRLQRARARRFVGRDAEIELVLGALARPGTSLAVAFVHGPGGVGKSALLRAMQDAAVDPATRVARLDLSAIEPAPATFCAALGDQLRRSASDVRAGDLGTGRCLLLLDTYEHAAALDGWLREQFVPSMPGGTVVVIAGREKPAPGWFDDQGWRDLLVVVPLRNLAPGDARMLLRTEGVPDELHEHLIATTHCHPLALTLLLDLLDQHHRDLTLPATLGAAPDLVQRLLERFVAGVPSERHRSALQVSAHARTTTQGLLRAALSIDDARDLFDWLRSLSFMEEEPRGIRPHDLARDVLVADAHWRDREQSVQLHRNVHDYSVARLQDRGLDPQQSVADLVFLHRANPFAARIWDWRSFGGVYVDTLRADDRDALLAIATRHEGDTSAALVAHWIDHQPDAFLVFRGPGTPVVGFAAMLALHAASAQDIAADPGTEAMWVWVQRNAPPRTGEEVYVSRFLIDAESYQAIPSPSLNAVTIASTQRWLTRRNATWEFITWADPDAAAPLMAYIGFQRAPGADFVVDGRSYGVYGHDWRRMDPERWLDMMGTRETAIDVEPETSAPEPTTQALSHIEFASAVRQALRDLHRREALAGNALSASRVVCDSARDASRGEALAGVIRDAVCSLRDDPRDAKLYRALDRTYVRPAGTQERAAEVLSLPMSTYRRHLARGVDRVVERLWHRELYGWQS